ncbi:DEAD/DEAH box helicase family protein [Tumebacillus sp. ITR2]|uniref:DEAD/DEAH box helicase family protein n=1 Tax=Tumebacillus amylolyticus TaxID=2801339 RepID=A0ABS1J9R3_9BACL|nr:DEAD/DEAH box helicase family protein [Tumebacillus amylolyticus]
MPNMEWEDALFDQFQARMKSNEWATWDLFRLAYEAERSRVVPNFDQLICLQQLPEVTPYPHQIETAKKVLNELHGRAILADEVGLGKTIEAGLILKEYLIRGLVKKILILVPSSLVIQWVRELNEKFKIPAIRQKNGYSWEDCDIVVSSIDTVKREPHREIVLRQEYDLVIVDEAHKLKNKKSKNYEMVNNLRKKYLLLLTATPVQNDMKELYNLITLLKPGQLGSQNDYSSMFMESKRTPKNRQELKNALSDVMIRNKRSEGGVQFTKRNVQSLLLDLYPEERELYESVTDFIKEQYTKMREEGKGNFLQLITLQRQICSSPYAALVSLKNMKESEKTPSDIRGRVEELYQMAEKIPAYKKIDKLIELIKTMDDKVIIFTEYRATQDFILYMLQQHGIRAVIFRGGFKRNKKDWMTELFKSRFQVLVATEAGGEGINLQFCNQLVNFDLPWNPMRLEQRIGRVHRLGQQRDVQIYNLSTRDTIEEHIVSLLEEKINMFEMVIGELDLILGNLKVGRKLDNEMMDLFMRNASRDEMKTKLDELGEEMVRASEVMR